MVEVEMEDMKIIEKEVQGLTKGKNVIYLWDSSHLSIWVFDNLLFSILKVYTTLWIRICKFGMGSVISSDPTAPAKMTLSDVQQYH